MRRSFVAVAAIVLLLALTSIVLFAPYYQSNDDVAMRLLLEGRLVPDSAPNAHLLFINILLGFFLKALYQLFPQVPLYDIFFLLMLMIGAGALLYLIRSAGRDGWIAAALILFAAGLLLPFFVALQFTMAAMLLTGAGTFLLLAPGPPARSEPLVAQLAIGMAMILVGFLLRFESAALACGLAALLQGQDAVSGLRRASLGRRMLVIGSLVAAILLSVLGQEINRLLYAANAGWSDFYRYIALRGMLTEWLPPNLRPAADPAWLRAVSWSPNDYAMLDNWFFTNQDLFSIDRLSRAVAAAYGGPGFASIGFDKLLEARNLAAGLLGNLLASLWRPAAAVLALAVMLHGWRGVRRWLYAVGVAAATLLAVGLAFKAVPFRLTWPILTLAAGWALCTPRRARRTSILVPGLAAIAATILIGQDLIALRATSAHNQMEAQRTRKDLSELASSEDRIFVAWGSQFPYEFYAMPFHATEHIDHFQLLGLGAIDSSGLIQDFLARRSIRDLPLTICSNDAYELFTSASLATILERYLLEHYAVSATVTPAFHGDAIATFRCSRSGSEPPNARLP